MASDWRRYTRTLRRFWGTALAGQLEYQLNLLIELLAMAGNLAGSLFVLSLFYGNGSGGSGPGLGGWSWPEAQVVLGVYTLLDGVSSTLLRPNLSRIVTHVQEGTLDFVLLKPIDSQFWLSARTVSPAGLPEIAVGLALMLGAGLKVGARLDAATLALVAVLLLSSTVILYALWFLLATTSIWFVKTWNATEVLRAALAAGRYPITAYPAGLRTLFTLVLPVAFLTTVPAEAVLGRVSGPWALASLGVAAGFLLLSRAFWRFALRFYTSASS
ncbi:ABC-2 family transporter protein [Vulcanococcus limneticus Candia 3F8]|uniref:ABC transporter permease n=1 Tax=Vulcanococcus limneticus TaxID=2170428 RepID=UPI000B9808D5|nr:ABC-2 family transporter protein [Vulcanococcus limneticus]MCP9790946.1 ABC-2 family transporter protein [Vulcanococcus limneticus MW73D5]MCP9892170.1 ABC-2 family transporter protein [Vulcanococcus limneticus Candia 3F8]MCP9896008.1 ABC-2 family transporter protein [Vulcanococcus limneticus Candia 3B3]